MSTKPRILIIRAGMTASSGQDAMEALIFPLIDQATPEGYAVDYVDDRTAPLPDPTPYDLIAISTETFAAGRAYHLATHYRSLGIKVVLGGFHPSICPDEALGYADSVIIGDVEDTWPRLLEDWTQHTLQKIYRSRMDQPLKPLIHRRRILKPHRSLPIGLIETSRGCHWACDFCSIHAMYPHSFRAKSPRDVARELQEIPQKIVFLCDDNLFRHDGSFEPLMDVLKQSGKRWACQISMEAVRDDDRLRLMKDSGCIMVLIGFESLQPENLNAMRKKANHPAERPDPRQDYEALVRRIYAHGLMIYATFVIGYPGDTEATFQELLDFANAMGFTLANFNPLIPMPGTPLYDRLEAEGKLTHPKWWCDPNYRYGQTTFAPEGMTAQALEDGCFRLRSAFYDPRAVRKRKRVNRLHRRPLQNFVYTLGNLVSRREILRKQGQNLQ